MANSVSKINVIVGANTQQLQSGMNQASAIVQRGMGNVQTVAQQATFAVDDFFASFSTGGLAGGLRGAGNNLTMIAASLGGIKTQLLVIAGLSVAQLLAKEWDKTGESIDKASKSLNEFQERLKRGSAVPSQRRSLNQQLRDISGETSLPEAFRRRESGRTELADLRQQLAEESKLIGDRQQLLASVIGDEATKAVQDEISERQKAVRTLRDEIREQERLNAAAEKQVRILQQRRQQFPGGGAGGLGGGLAPRAAAGAAVAEIDQQIAELRDSLRPSVSLADMFSRMPGANALGSSGAISAINAASIGPSNAMNAGPALQRETNRILGRIEALERQKKSVEAVAL